MKKKEKKIPAKKLKELDKKQKDKTIMCKDLPATLQKEFPGELKEDTLKDIENELKDK